MFTPGSQLPASGGEDIIASLLSQGVLGMSQQELAQQNAIKQQIAQQIVQGKISDAGAQAAASYAQALPFAVGGGVGTAAKLGRGGLEVLAQNLPKAGSSVAERVARNDVLLKAIDNLGLQAKIAKAGKTLPKTAPVNTQGASVFERYTDPEVRKSIVKQIAEENAAKAKAQQQFVKNLDFSGIKTSKASAKTGAPNVTNESIGEDLKNFAIPALAIGGASAPILSLISNSIPSQGTMQGQGTGAIPVSGGSKQGIDMTQLGQMIAQSIPREQQQAVMQQASPQDILLNMAQQMMSRGVTADQMNNLVDMIYRAGVLGQQDKYREAQINEINTRGQRNLANIQALMNRDLANIDQKIQLAKMAQTPESADEAARLRDERNNIENQYRQMLMSVAAQQQ